MSDRGSYRPMARSKTVLNVFSYTGAFSVYAVNGGCRSIVEIETNRHALQASRRILEKNFSASKVNSDLLQQIRGDAFLILDELVRQGKCFDLVILDPPAFSSRKEQKEQAQASYTRLVEAGARLTNSNGSLFAASCSRIVSSNDFAQAVRRGIQRAGRKGEEILKTGHPIDHPVTFAEGEYLKAVLCRITG